MDESTLIGKRFSRQQVLRMLGINPRWLSAWERHGFIEPSGGPSSGADREGRCYSFSDLVALKKLRQLHQDGFSPAWMRSLYAALKARLPGVGNPWTELQMQPDGKRLAVHFHGSAMEPLTGQLLLEYAPAEEAGKVQILQRAGSPRQLGESAWVRAERFFQAGLRYEDRPEGIPRAIRAYHKAIEVNPRAVGAHINLGTLYYKLHRLEEAESCYRAALSIDPGYGLVHFNLGNVYDETRQWDKARHCYEEAIRLNPQYPDPHYNLALLYEKLGLHGRARQQWLAYLKLDPHSPWADTARRQVEKTSMQVILPQRPSETGS
ncbi:MAG: tetratricopeptide repeat protein [Acidobacteria bacterium]|nr:tetratricopeptide repeat protein [Acidobacteriota bacterium]